jgi:hypothetical protein
MNTDVAENHYYVYEWFRPDVNECFYVGKGCGKRAYSFQSRNYIFMKILEELHDKKLCPEVRIYKANLTNKDALRIERERRAHWKARFVKLSNRAYKENHRRMRWLRNRPKPEVIARVRRIFG